MSLDVENFRTSTGYVMSFNTEDTGEYNWRSYLMLEEFWQEISINEGFLGSQDTQIVNTHLIS